MKLRGAAYNSHVRFLVLTAICLSFVTCAAKTPAAPLEGGIEHVDILPSLDENLRKGRHFSESLLEETGEPANEWIKLPAWMSGTWRIDKETTVYRKDFRKNQENTKPMPFQARQTFQYGMQKDKEGNVWHYIGVPYNSSSKLTLFAEHHLVSEKKFDRLDERMVRFRSMMKVVRVSFSKISESYQQESITSYEPIEGTDKVINLRASTKTFDDDGRPKLQADNVAQVKRVKTFTEVTDYKGRDMRKLLREYLSNKGLTNLIPD